MTLIGTPPNILASEALNEAGLDTFGMFDFAWVGVPLMILGTLFVALTGRFFLPQRDVEKETATATRSGQPLSADDRYQLEDRLFTAQLSLDSPLAGKTLAQSRLGDVLGVNVLGILRNGKQI